MTDGPGAARRGIYKTKREGLTRAWISERPGEVGEWLTEDEYRAHSYSPDFDRLPVKIVERFGPFPISIDDLPEVDRDFVRQFERNNRGNGS